MIWFLLSLGLMLGEVSRETPEERSKMNQEIREFDGLTRDADGLDID